MSRRLRAAAPSSSQTAGITSMDKSGCRHHAAHHGRGDSLHHLEPVPLQRMGNNPARITATVIALAAVPQTASVMA